MILIDIPMPTKCENCVFYNTDDYSRNCLLYSNGIINRYDIDGSIRQPWCELREIRGKEK